MPYKTTLGLLAGLCLLCVFPQMAQAQTTPQALAESLEPSAFAFPVPIEVFDLPPAPNGVSYRIYVRPPLLPPESGAQATSVYFMDAALTMTPAAVMVANYELFGYTPPAYFIGIGYHDGQTDRIEEFDRSRDYTPTAFAPPDADHFLANSPKDWKGSGGAPAFFDYLESTVIPFVEARYQVDRQERTLIGKSKGGLAASYALLERPGLFNKYVIISPSIWWDDWLNPRDQRWVMKAARDNGAVDYPVETRVYLAVGSDEERMGLVTDMYVLGNALRTRKGKNLKVYLDVLDGEMHEGIYPAAFMRGILAVNSDRRKNASPVHW